MQDNRLTERYKLLYNTGMSVAESLPETELQFQQDMAETVENVRVHPETSQFYDAFYLTEGMDAVLADACDDLTSRFERLAEIQASPSFKAYIEEVATEIEFALFAGPGEELPESLIITSQRLNGNSISRNPESFGSSFIFQDKRRSIIDIVGVKEIGERIASALQETKEYHIEKLREFVRKLPEFQFIESFDAKSPAVLEVQPLSALWRQIRERQIEDDLRVRYGIAATDPLYSHQGVLLDYKRRIAQLDDETMPNINAAQDSSPFDRLRQFFIEAAELGIESGRQYEKEYPKEMGDSATMYPEGPVSLKFDDSDTVNSTMIVMSDGQEHFASEFSNDEDVAGTDRSHYGYDISHPYLYDVARNLLYGSRFANGGSYQEYLEELAELYAERLFKKECQRIQSYGSGYLEQEKLDFLTPSGPTIPRHQYYKWISAINEKGRNSTSTGEFGRLVTPDIRKVELSSLETMERQFARTEGYVKNYPYTSNDRQSSRVMSFASEESIDDLPLITDDQILPSHLVINFQFGWVNAAYGVPGYDMIGRSKAGDVVYAKSEHDPYQVPEIAIGAEATAQLINEYKAAGLIHLAKAVEARKNTLTAGDLAKIISYASRYTIPDRNDVRPNQLVPNSISDFSIWVRDGELLTQCDGANALLQLSLNLVCSDDLIAVDHSGRVIQRGEVRITGMAHAQTMILYEGKQYLVDATPSRGDALPSHLSIRADGIAYDALHRRRERVISELFKDRSDRSPEPKERDVVERPELIKPELIEAKHKQEIVAQTLQMLEKQLQVIFNASNSNELHKALLKLPEYDPARRTYGLVLRTANGNVTSQQVIKEHIEYLENISNADLATRRQMGLEAYDLSFLGALRRYTSAIAQAA